MAKNPKNSKLMLVDKPNEDSIIKNIDNFDDIDNIDNTFE